MTLPVPVDWTTVPRPSAADMNREVRDGLGFLLNPPAASMQITQSTAWGNAAYAIPSATWTNPNFDTVDSETSVGMCDLANNRFIAPAKGVYRVTLDIPMAIDLTLPNRFAAGIGTTNAATGIKARAEYLNARGSDGVSWTELSVSGLIVVPTDGGFIYPWIYQDSGATRYLYVYDTSTHIRFSADWVCAV